ncbi:MAG TPA: hypothetical protein VGP07_02035 [Polyangia bacterium]|jgi:hypothetical protein
MSRAPSSVQVSFAGVFVLLSGLLAGCGGAADSRPDKWSFISPVIIQPSCATANCHSQLAERSGVALDTVYDGYAQLLNRHFVMPNDPTSSALVALLRGQGSRRMPPDFPLPEADIQLIEGWIAAGAQWDGPGSAPPTGPTP